ncbi:Haloacid dehalogenase-like hydrolase-domain-containing protein [Cyathus striatus]|nr:Haloacid dehalogenase-like hydrolase-domain-containing protein [Cyathus striatus]
MLSSSTWFAYEKGQIGEEECYSKLALEYNASAGDIRATLLGARKSLHPNHKFLSFIQSLRLKYQDLRIFAMSNIAVGDYDAIRDVLDSWNIFDGIYVSCNEGERKPHLGFYRSVISSTDVRPQETIFVDDKLENVLSARSVGLCGVVFDSCEAVIRKIGNLLGDPVKRGKAFLEANREALESVTKSGIVVRENFAQLLILEVTNDPSLVNLQSYPGAWNFFRDEGVSEGNFPLDLDTTSLAYSIMKYDEETVARVMDEMLKYMDVDGIIQTYFDHTRPRIDPVVCTNVLTLFHSQNRGDELDKTFDWVYEVLQNRAYLDGTRYYWTAECFLYFLMRLLQVALKPSGPDAVNPKITDLHELLKKRTAERVGVPGDSLALAMRLVVCKYFGIEDHVDMEVLRDLQCEDGGWEIGWVYKYGSSGVGIGNRGFTTALAVEALK